MKRSEIPHRINFILTLNAYLIVQLYMYKTKTKIIEENYCNYDKNIWKSAA